MIALKPRATAVAAAAAALMLAAGCTSAVNQQGDTGGTPSRGGTLRIVQGADVQPATLMSQNNPNFSLTRTVFNSLIQYDHKTLEPQPELATAWETSADGKTLTFTLREGVKFHDGRAFTAADVIADLEIIQRAEVASQVKGIAKQIAQMKAEGDTKLTITFKRAMSNTLDLFLMMPIIDPKTADATFAGTSFNGTGPFKVEKYTPGQGFTLKRNDQYWDSGKPLLDGVTITVVRDSQSMLSSLKSGQSELALDLAPLDATTIKNDPAYKLVESDANDSVAYVGYNVTVPLLGDKKVRQAISYAIDRDRILAQVYGGIGQVTSLPWAPSSPAYDQALVKHFTHDVDKAKSLLQEAGAAGKTVNVYYDSGFGPNNGMAEIIQFDLTAAGLKPNLQPLQASDFLSKLRSGGFDGMFVTAHGFGQIGPATLLGGAFPFNFTKNASSFVSPEYQQLAEKVWFSPGKPDAQTLAQVNDFLLDQQFVSDLVTSTHTYATSSKLQGLSWTMLDYLDLDDASLAK
ncbi:ABC transporter substrate-binding protein [Paractinoplanes lichenicola]|uniref:ABC transporter substrate-binding protein n=1 Tax=Paractinoplanes lichenicola TaxID=2802976 RepID=A0ABS1W068_9ACTN|nr:ABC transporter substrate-binding protein [Actinoplanes lichenicola]MBL7260129.1 ABC transporter substrate-binding protein [Actinoplanes lichenicola]